MAKKQIELTPEKKILKARMMINQQRGGTPFFSYLLSRLTDEEALWLPMPTAATDGEKLYWHPDFIAKLSVKEVAFVMCHEIMHLVLQHFARRGHRKRDKWGQAIDHELNLTLLEHIHHTGCLRPPEDILADPQYKDMTAEKIYTLIPNGSKDQPLDFHFDLTDMEGKSMKSDAKNKGMKIPVLANPASPAMQNRWQNRLQEAAENAQKHQGHIPGACSEIVKALKNPVIPWRNYLQERVCEILSREDYNWNYFNRMYIEYDLYLPACYNETIGAVAIIIDNSGSMSREQLSQMFSEFLNIRQHYNINELHLIQVDAQVQKHDIYSEHDYIDPEKIEVTGRGGTDFIPAFKYIEEQQIMPEFVCIMTDAYGSFPQDPPHYPVLAALTRDHASTPDWMDDFVVNV